MESDVARGCGSLAERDLNSILDAQTACPLTCELLDKVAHARDQLLTFCNFPGEVEATNRVSERGLRPCVIQRKVTNGYRAEWAAHFQASTPTRPLAYRKQDGDAFWRICPSHRPRIVSNIAIHQTVERQSRYVTSAANSEDLNPPVGRRAASRRQRGCRNQRRTTEILRQALQPGRYIARIAEEL